jgi:hypothetical protein
MSSRSAHEKLWTGGILIYLFLRAALAVVPGYPVDLQQYADWALKAARHGLSDVYRTSDLDYPPLYAYLLYPMGKIYLWVAPAGTRLIAESRFLTFLIKLPPLLFDLGIAWLLYETARRATATAWLATATAWRRLLPALFLLNPGVLFDTAYWGHPDSVYSFFALAAFLVLGARHFGGVAEQRPAAGGRAGALRRVLWSGSPELAAALLALAVLMKPIPVSNVPLFAALSLLWHGPRRTCAGVVTALAIMALVGLPFVDPGDPGSFIHRMFDNVGVMPFTTCNAHNIWWLLLPWGHSDRAWLGPFTPTHVAVGLFGLLYAGVLGQAWSSHRRQTRGLNAAQGFALAAVVAFGFFMFGTHLHENHMFPVLVYLLPLVALSPHGPRCLGVIFAAASLGVLLNMTLHDPLLSNFWPAAGGDLTAAEIAIALRDPFPGPLAAARLATLLNLATFLAFTIWVFLPRGRGLLARLAPTADAAGAR